MTAPSADLQSLNQGSGFITLWKVDLSPIGGSTYYLTNEGGNPSFGGQTYTSFPIDGTGFDQVLTGNQPKPTLSVSDVDKLFFASLVTLGDAVGGMVTRYRTFAKYLDGGSSPDGSRYMKDVYLIEQKTAHVPGKLITWQLSTISDRLGMYLPRRQFLQDKGFPGLGLFRT